MTSLKMETEIRDFFHNIVKGRRKKLQLNKIQNSWSNWLEEEA